jgi:hypothetical protein
MGQEFLEKINLKKIGNISLIVSIAIISYYSLSTYKTYLEIKQLKKKKNE